MDQNNAKGRNFLKVTGILMIIGGAIGLILSIIALLGVGALDYLSGGAVAGLLYASGIVALLGSVLEFVAGIVGVANSKKSHKATTCLVWGIIVAAMTVLSTILALAGGNSFGNQIASLLIGLVLPVLYIIGAVMNKKTQQ